MGCRLKASRLCFQSRPAALPAISKSTETQPSGQPSFTRKYGFYPTKSIQSLEKMLVPRSHLASPSKSIHHLPLDAIFTTFYSLPIFDTRLAPFAIPVAVKGRSQCATSQCPLIPPKTPKSTGHARNPAPPDGGQHTFD
jgi:hypothetical protein